MSMLQKQRDAPRLVPTGNVDDVLLTGKSRGRSLTLFQSIGLSIFGLCFVFGVGIPAIVFEFRLQSQFQKLSLPYQKRIDSLLFGIIFCLLGTSWLVLGLIGVVKAAEKSPDISLRCNLQAIS